MPNFYVNCTIVYKGGFEVEADNWVDACEKADAELDYGALGKEVPDSINVGGIQFLIAETSAYSAEQTSEG